MPPLMARLSGASELLVTATGAPQALVCGSKVITCSDSVEPGTETLLHAIAACPAWSTASSYASSCRFVCGALIFTPADHVPVAAV
jgi:hypothetical protein